MDDTIAVFTDARSDEIIGSGGLGDWVLNPRRARQCKYLVCCRKLRWNNLEEGVQKYAAFLVARIKDLKPLAKNPRGQERHFIEICEYVRLNKPDVWKDRRNPVAYTSLSELGIRPASLRFQAISDASKLTNRAAPTEPGTAGRLTIEQAKKALAETFGVNPEDIEITIRG